MSTISRVIRWSRWFSTGKFLLHMWRIVPGTCASIGNLSTAVTPKMSFTRRIHICLTKISTKNIRIATIVMGMSFYIFSITTSTRTRCWRTRIGFKIGGRFFSRAKFNCFSIGRSRMNVICVFYIRAIHSFSISVGVPRGVIRINTEF